jgi:hypothetical protein
MTSHEYKEYFTYKMQDNAFVIPLGSFNVI